MATFLLAAPVPLPAAAPAEALASAVRAAFDTPEEAEAALATLHAQHPEDDDVAWWLASVRLEAGRPPAEALALLSGRTGRKVPRAHFGWLRARALLDGDGARARQEIDAALAVALPGDPHLAEMRALAAGLAWAAGDEAAARGHVQGGPVDGFADWGAIRAPVRVEAGGSAYLVTAGGLAVPEAHATCGLEPGPADVVEVPGPALARGGGGACLGEGARADPARGGDGWVYAAVDAPEGEGI